MTEINTNNTMPFSKIVQTFEIVNNIEDGQPTFGILKLFVNPSPITNRHVEFDFYIDNSGSMDDMCSDNKTKLQHMKFLLKSIIRYLKKHNITATISLHSFDDNLIEIISSEALSENTIESFIARIDEIEPNGGTNIAEVLHRAASKSVFSSSDIERFMFLFTDGQANVGSTINRIELVKISKEIKDTTIVTVGCGLQHDYKLLTQISSGNNNIYKFIGKLEESGLACGEILDKLLNKVLKNVVISVQNGEIYDWKTNLWVETTCVENIVAECNKTFHIRSSTVF